jgi:hypothetical protein
MWRALKTEIWYFWPWLLGGLGIAAFVVIVLSVLVRFLEQGQGPPVFVIAMFPIIAGMVVSFVAQGYRIEERRARMLLAGPMTPRQLAWVTVLLPVCFVVLGILAVIPMIGLATLITGKFEASAVPMIAGFAGQFWAYAQLGPLAQESSAAHRERRTRATFVGWTAFAGAILILVASQFFMHRISGHFGFVTASVAAMGVAAVLYQGRTDFTR